MLKLGKSQAKWDELFFKDSIIYFLESGEGRETERERYINVWLTLTQPLLGTGPQLRHVP